jgi:hypothetical protein
VILVDDLLGMAEAIGVTVMVEDSNLILEHDADPPAELVEAFRRHKPDLVSALRMREADQRRRILRWINDHFTSSPPGVCAHCGGAERVGDKFVLLFVGNDRGEVHASCYPTWLAAREAEAKRESPRDGALLPSPGR